MFISGWLVPCSVSSQSSCNLSFSVCCWQLFPPSKMFPTRYLQRNLNFLTVFCISRFLRCSILTEQQRGKTLGEVCSVSAGAGYLVWLMPLVFPQIRWVCPDQTSWWTACAGQILLVQGKASWNFTLYFRCSRSWGSSGVKYGALWMNKGTHLSLSLFFSKFFNFKSPWTPWFWAAELQAKKTLCKKCLVFPG